MPSATPSAEDVSEWHGLSRDEQLKRLRSALTHPDSATPSKADMTDILRRAQATAKARRG
jgi:hypothetical protein